MKPTATTKKNKEMSIVFRHKTAGFRQISVSFAASPIYTTRGRRDPRGRGQRRWASLAIATSQWPIGPETLLGLGLQFCEVSGSRQSHFHVGLSPTAPGGTDECR